MDKRIIILVGPPGSGKSTTAKTFESTGWVRISQDDQGKDHLRIFEEAIAAGKNIVVDRMNFNKPQRDRYLAPARKAGYHTSIKVYHVPKEVCRERCLARTDHPTIKDEHAAANALSFFFKTYERPSRDEADSVSFENNVNQPPEMVVVFDIDGTVADIEHRRHHVRPTDGKKKDWRAFNEEMVNDTPKKDIITLVKQMSKNYPIVFASGRTDDFKQITIEWLDKALGNYPGMPRKYPFELYMRPRNDSRQDNIVKEIILDFEIQTRYDILFVVDDRDQVVKMWRDRGVTCLQCEYGDF